MSDDQYAVATEKLFGGKKYKDDVVRHFVDAWAQSSSNSTKHSILMQEAVRLRFGQTLGMQTLHGDEDTIKWAREQLKDSAVSSMMTDVVDAIYDNTQESLEEDHFLLFRGANWNDGKTPKEVVNARLGIYEGAVHKMPSLSGVMIDEHLECNPLSSFSTDYSTAQSFSSGGDTRGMIGAIIPKNRIFSTFVTGPGCSDESEFVVLGGDPLAARMTLGEDVPWSREKFLSEALKAEKESFAAEAEPIE